MNLHAKFLFLVLGSLTVFLGILSAVIVQRETKMLAAKTEEKQHLLASTFVADLRESMLSGRPHSTLALMKSIRGTHDLVRLDVLESDGDPAFGMEGPRFNTPQFTDAIASHSIVHFHETGNPPRETIIVPLTNDDDCRNCHRGNEVVLGAVVVSLSLEDSLREINNSRKHLLTLLSLITLAIGSILYFAVRKAVLKPLSALHDGAERLGRGDLAHRITLPADDELRTVATAFNDMAGRLEEARAGLEEKISERTARLEEAMDDARDKAARLYMYSRDMAALSRLTARVFNAELTLDELLDRFMGGISRRLGYTRAMVCLVDRKRAWLDVTRNVDMSGMLPAEGLSLLGGDSFAKLVRTSRLSILDAGTLEPLALRETPADGGQGELYVVPLLSRTHTKRCWELTSCIKTDCPAHPAEAGPCWLVDGTLCGDPFIESFGDKLAYCMTCKVFPVIGVLIIGSDPAKRPSRSRNVGILRILAAEMAAALENHRLHEANQRMVRELLELHRVTAAALRDPSLIKALDVFAEAALKFPGMDGCAFWLLSSDGRDLVRGAGGTVDGSELSRVFSGRIPAAGGPLGRALDQENAVVTDYGMKSAGGTPLSVLAISLRGEGGPLGVFSVYKRDTMPFLEAEIAAFMLLANQASMALNVCVLSDELKKQNRELARQSGLVGGILSSMSSGIMLLDGDMKVKLINEVGARILRSGREALVDRSLVDRYPETAVFTESSTGPYQETAVRTGDGAVVPIGFSTTYYRGGADGQDGIIVVFRDLSEIKALQAELMSKERFAAMGRVVAGVAHEIRNPLFGISSVGQILERELQNPAHRELVGALLSETKRMNQLIEELLLYGRPMKLVCENCSLPDIWREVIAMHREELNRRDIRLADDLECGQVTACLDANQIRQVFLNLLRNAVDATPRGGSISIRMLLEDRFIIFKIADTGAGIPPAHLDKVFDLFFTTKAKGTGLGLAICRKIVQDHGGDISLASEEGKGTAVTVKLPYRGQSGNTGKNN